MDDPTLIDGRYRRGAELGSGAFGSVYKATQVVLGHDMRDVALKLFRGEAVNASNVRKMMNDALAILGLLDGLDDWEVRQHFVTVYDLGVTRGPLPQGYVAMELVRGGSLEGRLRDLRRFTPAKAFDVLHQLARALAYMHDAGHVHSDLKPANVLVYRGRGRELIKVGDFGLAGRYLGPLGAGPAGGTLSYLPAEALRGLPTTPSGDVFSLGVMAYEMLTGSNPYNEAGERLDPDGPFYREELNRAQLAARHPALALTTSDFPELAAAGGPVSELAPLLDVVNRMLAESLRDRYPSARPVFDDFERIAERLPPVLRTGGADPPPKPDPVAESILRCEGCLERGELSKAKSEARSLTKLAPDRPNGYLLLSQARAAEAARLPAGSQVAKGLLREALKPLEEGLEKCHAPADQRLLRLEMANIYQRLGQDDQADQFRGQSTRERRP